MGIDIFFHHLHGVSIWRYWTRMKIKYPMIIYQFWEHFSDQVFTYGPRDMACPRNDYMRKWRMLTLNDKIRPQYVRRKDMKDTIERYIVLLPDEKGDSCQRDSEWWRVLGACTYIVIDDGVTSIGYAFDRGSARIGKITFLRTCPFLQLTTDLHTNYY